MAKQRMNLWLVSWLLLTFFGAAEVGLAQYTYAIVDEINTSASVDSGDWGAGNSHGFEYTPATSYTFHRIEAKFGQTVAFPITVAVYDGRNGPLLASGSGIPVPAWSWFPFDLDVPVSFTAGATYFIAIQPPTATDALPGIIVGGDTVLPWWFSPPGPLDFNTAFGTQSPGFKFYLAQTPLFNDGFEEGDTDNWDDTIP